MPAMEVEVVQRYLVDGFCSSVRTLRQKTEISSLFYVPGGRGNLFHFCPTNHRFCEIGIPYFPFLEY